MIALAAGGGYWLWKHSRPRVITVSLYPDYAFRQHPQWKELLASRTAAASRIFSESTGVQWKIASIETEDPIDTKSDPMDARRTELARNTDKPADVLVIVTGLHEGIRTGSVNPFSHAGVIADFPKRSESQNTLIMVHELAHFFGAPNEPGSNTVMEPEPASGRLSPRATTLIRSMRDYDFHQGVAGLEGSWGPRALSALTTAYQGLQPNPAAQANREIASALAVDGRYASAIQHLKDAIKADPRSAPLQVALALVLIQDSQSDAAVAAFREAIRLKPDDAQNHAMLASLLAKRDFESSVAEYQTAIRLNPKNPGLYEALGTLLTSAPGRIDQAIAAFQQALALNPQYLTAQLGLTKAQTLKDTAHQAATRLSQMAATAKTDWNLYYRLGIAEFESGNPDASAKALIRAAELNPQTGKPHNVLALMYFVRGNYAAARGEVEKSRQLGDPAPKELETAVQAKLAN